MMFSKKSKKSQPAVFDEYALDGEFDSLMKWVKELSRKDYNRLKKAMDLGYSAYQTLHGIDVDENNEPQYMVSEREN